MAQQTPSVDVTGEGTVSVVPDQVTIRVRVENTGKNAKDLKKQNDAVVSEVLRFLRKSDIPDGDVTTDYIRLSKNYEYNTKTYNYAANQAISVHLKDLGKYETIMNGLMESGINRIDGISFASSRQAEIESQARNKAIQHAKMKATEYATALGQSIGKAISISEFQATVTPQPMMRAMAMDAGAADQTVAPGEMDVRVRVNVRFTLN